MMHRFIITASSGSPSAEDRIGIHPDPTDTVQDSSISKHQMESYGMKLDVDI